MPPVVDKRAAWTALYAQLHEELALVQRQQRETAASATHEEARAENDKDTRGLETSYLARGLARRVVELSQARSAIGAFAPSDFDESTAIAVGALVTVEDDDTGDLLHYLLAPAGGGISLDVDGVQVQVLTPQAPLGRGLLGRRVDDDVQLRRPSGVRSLTVVAIA